jgi:transcription elongation factor GreA
VSAVLERTMRRYPVTPEGHANLKKELRQLIEVERGAIVLAIETARAHGDLSENAEYDSAKEKQGMIEARIRDLEGKISMSEVIDPGTIKSDRIQFGATVTLEDSDTGESLQYMLVGGEEADLKRNRISLESPIARALIGKEEGDEVKIKVPKGTRIVEVVSIEYR